MTWHLFCFRSSTSKWHEINTYPNIAIVELPHPALVHATIGLVLYSGLGQIAKSLESTGDWLAPQRLFRVQHGLERGRSLPRPRRRRRWRRRRVRRGARRAEEALRLLLGPQPTEAKEGRVGQETVQVSSSSLRLYSRIWTSWHKRQKAPKLIMIINGGKPSPQDHSAGSFNNFVKQQI